MRKLNIKQAGKGILISTIVTGLAVVIILLKDPRPLDDSISIPGLLLVFIAIAVYSYWREEKKRLRKRKQDTTKEE